MLKTNTKLRKSEERLGRILIRKSDWESEWESNRVGESLLNRTGCTGAQADIEDSASPQASAKFRGGGARGGAEQEHRSIPAGS